MGSFILIDCKDASEKGEEKKSAYLSLEEIGSFV
jgi:hypothetical protein